MLSHIPVVNNPLHIPQTELGPMPGGRFGAYSSPLHVSDCFCCGWTVNHPSAICKVFCWGFGVAAFFPWELGCKYHIAIRSGNQSIYLHNALAIPLTCGVVALAFLFTAIPKLKTSAPFVSDIPSNALSSIVQSPPRPFLACKANM